MLSSIDISTSALVAQRTRLNAISGNIANMSTLVDENGEANPYRARDVVFQAQETASGQSAGVAVAEVRIDQSEPNHRYQPEHPLAIQEGPWEGYVAYPNIDLTGQMVDAMEATRAYEANVGVIEISKQMARQRLSILG